jgi:uncharacterized protein (DUF885 family)
MDAALDALATDYWEWTLREFPVVATYLGDFRYNDRLNDVGPESRARRAGDLRGFLARLDALDGAGRSESERISADTLRLQCESALEEERHGFWQWDVDQMQGPQADFPQLLNFHPRDDRAGLEARYRAFPAFIDGYLGNLRVGIREGRCAVLPAVDRVCGQLRELLDTPPERSVFAAHPDLLPAVAEAVYPAYRRMLTFLDRDYRPHARTEPMGLGALPGGREAYAFRVRHHTTTTLSPREIHEIGLQEMLKLEDEMRRIAGPDLPGFRRKLQADRRNFFDGREELLEAARRELAKAEARLGPWFWPRTIPRNRCEVKAIEAYREKDSVAAFYYPPDEGLTRRGIFYANTFEPETRPRFNLPALTIHEAVPGHHLQLALALEIRDLPRFRRNASFTAFVEGWALYTERLADEMGFYEDDLARFGMLTYQAWRAARLVVDTGLHALGWTRRRAADFFLDRVELAPTEVLNEVDRYIIWPGQALAYMIGQREILALREESRRTLGSRFDVRDFHDVVLRNGALPLTTLGSVVRAWASR